MIFLISSLGIGGSERIVSDFASFIVKTQSVCIVCSSDIVVEPGFEIDPAVEIIWLVKTMPNWVLRFTLFKRVIKFFLLGCFLFRNHQHKAVAFSADLSLAALVFSLLSGQSVVASERSAPKYRKESWIFDFGRKHLYPRAAGVVVQTERARDWFEEKYDLRNVAVIANPILMKPAVEVESGPEMRVFLCVGRMVESKRWDIAITAFAKYALIDNDSLLVMAGDGPELASLKMLATNLNVSEKVRFLGPMQDVSTLYAMADVFIFPSRYEGFPNVLLECAVFDLPVVAFKIDFGVEEIIDHGVTGILVDDDDLEGFYSGLSGAICLKKQVIHSGYSRIREAYSKDKIYGLWASALGAV